MTMTIALVTPLFLCVGGQGGAPPLQGGRRETSSHPGGSGIRLRLRHHCQLEQTSPHLNVTPHVDDVLRQICQLRWLALLEGALFACRRLQNPDPGIQEKKISKNLSTVHEMLESAEERCERVVGKAAAVQENKIGILRVANWWSFFVSIAPASFAKGSVGCSKLFIKDLHVTREGSGSK
jgi:hypothetical protein